VTTESVRHRRHAGSCAGSRLLADGRTGRTSTLPLAPAVFLRELDRLVQVARLDQVEARQRLLRFREGPSEMDSRPLRIRTVAAVATASSASDAMQ